MLYEADPTMRVESGRRPPGRLLFKRQYPNQGVSNFLFQVKRFLADANCEQRPPVVACLALAGPVTENRCLMTNRGWVIDGYELSLELGIKEVRLVNDFVAAGFGLLTLDLCSEVLTLQEGARCLGAPIACIGSGTGLGETFLAAPHGSTAYEAFPTEGGHVALAPRSELEFEMVQWMKEHLHAKRISVERVVSGRGIATVYEFLAQRFPERVDRAVHDEFLNAGDLQGAVISRGAKVEVRARGSLCRQTLEMWATHYGMEAGHAALKFMPLGGLFLAGGMTPKLIDWLTGPDSCFMKAFKDQGRVSPMLDAIPIYAVLEEDIGQRGAHYAALMLYQREEEQHHLNDKQVVTGVANSTTTRLLLAVAVASAATGAVIARLSRN
ncbi:glucokinase [Tribonema minus]|uniref:Glucokinase n=1 Tax=Tribonema minus TaxID=303371 RepID=A0A835YKJ2_9STRA|nr:glucokinase [Tribonema minus]